MAVPHSLTYFIAAYRVGLVSGSGPIQDFADPFPNGVLCNVSNGNGTSGGPTEVPGSTFAFETLERVEEASGHLWVFCSVLLSGVISLS